MLAACTSGMAQVLDGNAEEIKINEGINFLPSTFTTDGKTYISIHSGDFYKPDAETLDITLYDEEITPVHSFKLPQVENGMEYKIIDQRGWIHIIYPDDTELWSCTGEWSKTREDLNWDTPAIPMSFIDSDDADYIPLTIFTLPKHCSMTMKNMNIYSLYTNIRKEKKKETKMAMLPLTILKHGTLHSLWASR